MASLNKRLHQELGQKVNERRKALGLSQGTLSESIGLTRSSIANIEAGRQKISVQTLYDLAHALKTTPAELLPPPFEALSVDKGVRMPKGLPKAEEKWISDVLRTEKG